MDDDKRLGRSAYERRAWGDAFEALSRAAAADPLDAVDADRAASPWTRCNPATRVTGRRG
jgi:hypothetical protein